MRRIWEFVKNVWYFRHELWRWRWWDYQYHFDFLIRGLEGYLQALDEGRGLAIHESDPTQVQVLLNLWDKFSSPDWTDPEVRAQLMTYEDTHWRAFCYVLQTYARDWWD